MKSQFKTIIVAASVLVAASSIFLIGCSEGPQSTEINREKQVELPVEEDQDLPEKSVGFIE